MPRSRGHYRIKREDVLFAHEVALMSGGLAGIKSEHDLLSAIGRPYTGYYRSIHRKAAALFQSLACNHAFNDGNKRTAIISAIVLIHNSGYRFYVGADPRQVNEEVEAFVLAVVDDHMPIDDIAEWFKAHIGP